MYVYICTKQKQNIMAALQNTKELIRVRIFPFDFDGTKSDRDYVCYVKSTEEAEKKGWKYEIA